MIPRAHPSERLSRRHTELEWCAPVNTALGAVIGVGATLVTDRRRRRQERDDRAQEVRRRLYADYSAALSRMRSALNECANSAASEERGQRVRELFLAPGAYELRHQLAILAPHEVIQAARTAFLVLRDTRDRLLEGATADSPEYARLEDAFDLAVADLRRWMRRDLGAPESLARQGDR